MATDIIARGMAANAKKSVTELGNKIESEKWIGTKAEWEAVDKSTIKDGTIVYITDDKTVILYDKAEMEKIAAQVATDRKAAETAAQTAQAVADSLPDDYTTAVGKIAENTVEINNTNTEVSELKKDIDTKANKTDVLSLEEIQASTDLSGKIASASAFSPFFNVKQGNLSTCKYIQIGKLVVVSFWGALSDGTVLGIPSVKNNCIITLRNESVGGIAQVCLTSNGIITPGAGNSNFVDGHNYGGIFAYVCS